VRCTRRPPLSTLDRFAAVTVGDVMVIRRARQLIGPYARNVGGWRTRRKLLVIESDDWGSIRMPSRDVYQRCLAAGYPVDRTWYERYDSLLSETDLEALFTVLTSYTDEGGNPPVITANVIVANPDFEAIAADDFNRYHYEILPTTFERYPQHAGSLALWREGQRLGVFHPQFHGREHLNVALFMSALQGGDPTAHFAFEHRMPGCIPPGPLRTGNPYVEATRFRSEVEKDAIMRAQVEGLKLFESLFDFRSRTMMPTNYRWSGDFDAAVAVQGVEGFQGASVTKEQQPDGSSRQVRRHVGDTNAHGQTYLVRNVTFEPSQSLEPRERTVDRSLHEIHVAFQMRKPAVISSHRLNYCGFIDARNRDSNLQALRHLLDRITRTWGDVEFITSDHLLDLIRSGGNPVLGKQ
jgi:hypothetical protein